LTRCLTLRSDTQAFRFEREMAPMVQRWLSSRGLLAKAEYTVPWGICDYVGLALNKVQVRRRIKFGLRQPIGPALRISILLAVPGASSGKSIPTSELAALYDGLLSLRRIQAELDRLQHAGFIKATSPAQYQRTCDWTPLQRKIVAVELKLTRTAKAIRQAEANLRLADESYIALPMPLAHRAAARLRNSDAPPRSIGIIGVSGTGHRTILRSHPHGHARDEVVRMHCAERFWPLLSKTILSGGGFEGLLEWGSMDLAKGP